MKTFRDYHVTASANHQRKPQLLAGSRYWCANNVAKSRVEWAVFIVVGLVVTAAFTYRFLA